MEGYCDWIPAALIASLLGVLSVWRTENPIMYGSLVVAAGLMIWSVRRCGCGCENCRKLGYYASLPVVLLAALGVAQYASLLARGENAYIISPLRFKFLTFLLVVLLELGVAAKAFYGGCLCGCSKCYLGELEE